jgi:HK97 family phage major capsid protein
LHEILRAQLQQKLDSLAALRNKIAENGGEPSEAEKANIDVLRGEIEKLNKQCEEAAELDELVSRSAAVVDKMPIRTGQAPGKVTRIVDRNEPHAGKDGVELLRSMWPTPGDYMHDVIHSYQGDREAREKIERAIQNSVTGDVPGLVPEPIVGDIVKVIDASRPVVASLRQYPMPQYGSSFTRPKVTQNVQVGIQAQQKTELPSRKFLVDPIPVTKQTLGGAIDVAFQVIDWTSPSALNAITDDLADQYAIQTEDLACTVVETAAKVTNVANKVTITADAEIAAFYEAAGKVYLGCKRLPDTVYASVDEWVWLGSLLDGDGRPLFPNLAPMNAPGQLGGITTFSGGPLGARLVVSPEFAADTLIVAASSFAETYEDRRGALRVVEPKLLGWEIAYYGYFASVATVPAAFVAMEHL